MIVTVPWESQAAILDEIAPHVAGKLVVDTTVPLVPPRVARVQLPPEHSAALTAQKRLGAGVRVVSAFHNVAGHKLQTDEAIDCDVLIFGDDPKDRAIVPISPRPPACAACTPARSPTRWPPRPSPSVLIGINRNYKVDGAGIRITGI